MQSPWVGPESGSNPTPSPDSSNTSPFGDAASIAKYLNHPAGNDPMVTRKNTIKIITEPQNAWVKQVRQKYKFRSWPHPTPKSNISSYWNKLLLSIGASTLDDLHTIVVNGDDINLWDDPWLQGIILSRTALEVRWESSALFQTLRDFITDGAWNARTLEAILGPCL